ncbi:MAG: DUF1549 domain-containing protein [Cyclobacteriaceae bacterium]
MSTIDSIFQLFGRFHPLLLHFPIGLLLVAFLFEILTIGGKRQGLREGIKWMVYLGAGLALLSALSGWLLRTFDDYSGDLVDYHQYTGISTVLLASVTAILLYRTLKQQTNFSVYRISFSLTVILLTVAGHLGANLTHGEDYLTSVFNEGKEGNSAEKSTELLAALSKTEELSEAQQVKLNMGVRAILAHNCYQCHSENKQKGGLILDSKEGVFRGGESGKVIIAGNPEASELYKRITLPSDADGVMPKKGKTLKNDEIDLIRLWIKNGAYWSDESLKIFPEAPLALEKPSLPQVDELKNPIDKLIDVYFSKQDIDWPEVVDDRVFIRRAYADIVGLLPEPETVQIFIKDSNPNKRAILIDSLLVDHHNYTQHWLSFWNDLLRNDYSGPGYITRDRVQFTDWLYKSLLQNKSYDQMVKELVNPNKRSQGFIKGVQWRGVVNASQRTEMQAAQNIGQVLMGVNVKCASCHNSFISNLTLEQSYGFASIFADSVLELNRCDKPIGKYAKVEFIYPELGSVEAATLKERLRKLSEVMVKPENGRLYRTITNRYWDKLMGRGIIEPLDEMDNTPWNADLLDWLASDFIDSGSDLKQLLKLIMTSKAYQLPIVPYEKEQLVKTNYVFEGPLVRRMSAEHFSDAVSQIISPMFKALEYNPHNQKLPANRIWKRQTKFGQTVLPDPGKRFFRRSFELSPESMESAKAIISVDHSYVLYINGTKLLEGNDWQKVGKVDLIDVLVPGKNIIALEAENEGTIANPAGILFALKIEYPEAEPYLLSSDIEWLCTEDNPDSGWTSLDYDDQSWENVHNYDTRNYLNWGKLLEFTFEENNMPFARASLVKQHPFLKILGRPIRDIVTTSREEQATLLQALELNNGEFFNTVLKEGASEWINRYNGDGEQIVNILYQKAFSRDPSEKEYDLLIDVLGEQADEDRLQDVFWTTLILPEFQFIN